MAFMKNMAMTNRINESPNANNAILNSNIGKYQLVGREQVFHRDDGLSLISRCGARDTSV